MNLKLGKRFRIQTGRTRQLLGIRKWFDFEWQRDIVCDELMVASVTVFKVSFVYLGTAA